MVVMHMRRIFIPLGFFLFTCSLFSCGYLPSDGRGTITTPTPIYEFPQDYFPLTIGASWRYEHTYTSDFLDSSIVTLYTSTNVKDTIVDGLNAVYREYVYDDSNSSSAIFAIIADSIRRRYAEDDWKILVPVNIIPNSRLGDTLWSEAAGQNLATWIVLRTDTVLTTPAGRFDPCLYVHYQNRDTTTGEVWYFEDYVYHFGVGLISMTRETNGVNRSEYILQEYHIP